ncbi:MAG: Nudix family hydrolase [Wenzhouxiangellaceae bacterium]
MSDAAPLRQITVAAGIIYRGQNELLLAQRPPKAHEEGWWEFPGGKLEAGETPHQALVRELQEELDIEVLASRPFMSIRHRYNDREVHLLVREVLRYQGEPRGAEGQPVRWVGAAELPQWRVLPADAPVIKALRLPHQYVITPDLAQQHSDLRSLHEALMRGLRRSLDLGLRLFQLRLPGIPTSDLLPLARAAVAEVDAAGGRLLINHDIELAQRSGAHGVHLKARQLSELKQRPDAIDWLAASTHTAEELSIAGQLQCDFVCVSPVRRTPSHAQATPLNWPGLAALLNSVNLPAYALGGVRLDDLDQAREAGAVGVAGIRGFWPL